MKRKFLPKSFFLAAAIFSLSSFVFVNLHANLTPPQQCAETKIEQAQLKECSDAQAQEVPIPDVTALGRLLQLAQRFLPVAN